MFRHWSNKKIILQVCALGYNLDSNKIQCAEQQTNGHSSEITLAVFDLVHEIREPFTVRNSFAKLNQAPLVKHCANLGARYAKWLLDYRRNCIYG